ncbi:MAG: hypothetical protein K0R39_1431 [Symbiobacteriaceae bacterium]|jgi:hypothetical protein|nr:hypothetical protein [Symbiobacteriaceae bacterium]
MPEFLEPLSTVGGQLASEFKGVKADVLTQLGVDFGIAGGIQAKGGAEENLFGCPGVHGRERGFGFDDAIVPAEDGEAAFAGRLGDKRAVGGDNELDFGEGSLEGLPDCPLPPGVEVGIDFVDQDDA